MTDKPVKLKEMPVSGKAWKDLPGSPHKPTPQCESTVQVVGEHAKRWRVRELGDKWQQCTRPSTVVIRGVCLCRRHAGERVLEMYLAGEIVDA